MKSKRIISLIIIMLFVTSNFTVMAKENSQKTEVIFESREITNPLMIQYRLDSGITEDEKFVGEAKISGDETFLIDGKNYTLKLDNVKSTSQKIKTTKTDSGEEITEYVGYIEATVVQEEEGIERQEKLSLYPELGNMVAALGDDTLNDEDSGYNARAYVRVNYYKYTIDTFPVYKVTNVRGKVDILDSSVTATKLELYQYYRGDRLTSISPVNSVGTGQWSNTAYKNSPSSGTWYGSSIF